MAAGIERSMDLTKEIISAVVGAVFLVAVGVAGCSPSQPTDGEKRLLASLDAVAAIANSPGDGQTLTRQLNAIRDEIDAVKQAKDASPCFVAAAERCRKAYVLAGQAWEKRLSATDTRRIADLEMTYHFSLSFASLTLEQARDCYNKP